ncbi:DNA adenine methylase [Chromobacterium subtsugae]|uniref:DNA adenine methylase n=1 Tax=Chromobacterium subtsugae TaxID=251747 RepID=UPI0009BC19F8|nr:DNA adenine methylase [Chromobacterium subtsugae]
MALSTHYSPLRYPGGKSSIFPFSSDLILRNDLAGIRYAEPYAGGAGLALKLLFNEYVSEIHLNDFDKAIYTFWHCILNQHGDICDWLEDVEISVDNWSYYRSIYTSTEKHTPLDIAKAVLFLNRTNVSGVLKGGGIIGGSSQTGKYKIDARFNKSSLISKIDRISQFKNRIFISNYDGVEFIRKINRRKGEFLIYLDPPYFQKGAQLYLNFFKKEDHKKLNKAAEKIKKHWFMSYDNNEFISSLYKSFDRVTYQLSHSTSNRVGHELLIFPETIKFEESIKKLNSPIKQE